MEPVIRDGTTCDFDEVIDLYGAVGWSSYTGQPEALKRGLENSLLVLAAYDGERLCGLLRAVGDGQTVVLIQDILVSPAYQRRGVGTALMRAVLERFDHVRQIQLTTDNTPKTVAFYESLGFRPLSELGCCGFMKG